MSLNEFIAQLQQLRALHGGDLQVWPAPERSPIGPRAYVAEMIMDRGAAGLPSEKVVLIE